MKIAWMNAYRTYVTNILKDTITCSYCNDTKVINNKVCPYCKNKQGNVSETDKGNNKQ